MEKHWVCKQVTTCTRKCVDKGHWECREVEVKPLFAKKKKCCNSCDPCNTCCKEECPKYKTKKCWVANKCWIETPCTKTVKVCEYRPVTKTVNTCEKQSRCETYKVTVCKCVPHQKTERPTPAASRRRPTFEATRCVVKCVHGLRSRSPAAAW